MTLQQINYVIAISETGSMSKAAEKLYLSQPTLTNSIQELESELGFRIFNRSRKGVTLTAEGAEFLPSARQLFGQYSALTEHYGLSSKRKWEFAVSTQHYSFAVKAFVELTRRFDPVEYQMAIRETRTLDVLRDVSSLRSEIGILYLDDYNRKAIEKIIRDNELEFHSLIECAPYVYLWRRHPLAGKRGISLAELEPYPCISFEQGHQSSFYMAEEILSTHEYSRVIKVCDRATALNLMVGLNGYTLCSGIICEELNGRDYVAIPYRSDRENPYERMEIGYITRKHTVLSRLGEQYIREIKRYLGIRETSDEAKASQPCSGNPKQKTA